MADDVRPDAPLPDAPLPGSSSAPDRPDTPHEASGPVAPTGFYVQRRARRWPWVVVPVVGLALVAGGFLVANRQAITGGSPAPAPVPTSAIVPAVPGEQPGPALPGAGGSVLFLQSETVVQRADLDSGAVALTATPRIVEPMHLFAGPGWVASKTADAPNGVVVRDGGVAQVLPVALQQAGRAYSAGSDGIWSVPQQVDANGNRVATVVDLAGNRVGDASVRVPGTLGVPTGAVGSSLLVTNAEGTYEVDAVGSRPVSRGTLLGTGSDAVLTWDCDAKQKCDARINQTGRAPRYLPAVRKSLQGLYSDVATASAGRGVLSPDRRWVALELPRPTRSGARLVLVELRSGHRVEVPGGLAAQSVGADQAAWTPNSRYLLALTDGRLRAFDSSTEKVVTIGGTLADLRHLTIAGSATM